MWAAHETRLYVELDDFRGNEPLTFQLIFFAALLAGAIAALSGFGIGSILTPLFALHMDTKLAVALVSVPHLIATAARFATLKGSLDRRIFINFGLLSAAGGFSGALLNAYVGGRALTIVFACLLLFAGISGVSGFANRMRFGRRAAWIAGATSGFFGGLVGNQGGIRSAALMGFAIPKEAYVATATAIGLIVDAARMPVYFSAEWHGITSEWKLVAIATVGVLAGTFGGVHMLKRISEQTFRLSLSVLITALGVYMMLKGFKLLP
ncbi:MAG: hypothetical protein JWO13_2580 [Acidobacteriales bacterium]|nr:hypothetical protein [Terriglobales bacterium]